MKPKPNCKDLVRAHLQSRIDDLRKLWALQLSDLDARDPDLGTLDEYGLCFDYVTPLTFPDQTRGYFRYQLSWGGPSDEFRYYCDEWLQPVRIEYWYMDWYDGASVRLRDAALKTMLEIWSDWMECDLPKSAMAKAVSQ